MSRYRPSYHFQVTTAVPCPICNTFVKEEDVKKRSRYVWNGGGWIESHGCQACFDKAIGEAEQIAKDYKGWDYV